jgi:hypothetical protein
VAYQQPKTPTEVPSHATNLINQPGLIYTANLLLRCRVAAICQGITAKAARTAGSSNPLPRFTAVTVKSSPFSPQIPPEKTGGVLNFAPL